MSLDTKNEKRNEDEERNRNAMSEVFESIKAGLEEGISIAKGEADPATYRIFIPEEVDVKALRKQLGMSQERFAIMYGFSVSNVRNWEQGRRRPAGATRTLLTVISRIPEEVNQALSTKPA